MADDHAHTRLTAQISDVLAMEETTERMLRGMIRATDDTRVRARLRAHVDETRDQRARLEGRLEAHGESPSDAPGTEGGAARSMLAAMSDGQAERDIRDGYAAEHLEIASYVLLERTAELAGDMETAMVARVNREEEEDMARFFARRWVALAWTQDRTEAAA